MDLFTMIGACLRRWYVTVPLVSLAGWAAYQAYEAVEPVYTTTTSIVVLPAVELDVEEPDEEARPEPNNPYAGSGGARFAATVLARNINTDGYRTTIGITDPDVTFDASVSNQQPIISVEAFAPSPEEVYAALDAVTASANDVLAGFQVEAGAPDAKLYRIAPAVPADKVEDVTPSRFRSAGAIFAVGLVLAAGIGTALDSLLRRRAERRAERETDADPDGEEGDTGVPPEATTPEDGAIEAVDLVLDGAPSEVVGIRQPTVWRPPHAERSRERSNDHSHGDVPTPTSRASSDVPTEPVPVHDR